MLELVFVACSSEDAAIGHVYAHIGTVVEIEQVLLKTDFSLAAKAVAESHADIQFICGFGELIVVLGNRRRPQILDNERNPFAPFILNSAQRCELCLSSGDPEHFVIVGI